MPRPAIVITLVIVSILYLLSRTRTGALAVSDVTDAALGALPRGIRNNNPGNIDYASDPKMRWRGTIANDGRFAIFDTPANGVRAIAKELLLDDSRGVRTINGLISNWAPPTENLTGSYATSVADAIGISPDATLNVRANLPGLVAAIIRHENGTQPYPFNDLKNWVYLT